MSDETAAATPARIPRLERICIRGVYFPAARRVRDPASWYPSFKAAIDGLTHKKRWALPDGRPRCRYPHPLSGGYWWRSIPSVCSSTGRLGALGNATIKSTIWLVTRVPDARLAPIGPRCLLIDRTASGAFVTSQATLRGVLRGRRIPHLFVKWRS
ncbi:hypothetical protein [Streptomyces antimycoticus]|uniref:hypothetical protein n=1 Tax=Streptomyces antimycoticus TaxID=68175 RepID=UPI00257016EC|nr:hypothetical protein [Streptomyces antimycoticus]WJE00940.1 hypothetical protein QR300_36165 [Streptomyces antimycoticus]